MKSKFKLPSTTGIFTKQVGQKVHDKRYKKMNHSPFNVSIEKPTGLVESEDIERCIKARIKLAIPQNPKSVPAPAYSVTFIKEICGCYLQYKVQPLTYSEACIKNDLDHLLKDFGGFQDNVQRIKDRIIHH